jgi:predicted nucleotidyltransferase
VTTNFGGLIRALADQSVEFVLVGGLAAAAHGSARATYDVDVLYRRTPDNIGRVVKALAPLQPYVRGAPPGLPFAWDTDTIARGLNFTLVTSEGDIDLLGELTYGGTYEVVLPGTEAITAFGVTCRCLSLAQLIQVKRAAGRPKDLEALAELEAIAEERRQ